MAEMDLYNFDRLAGNASQSRAKSSGASYRRLCRFSDLKNQDELRLLYANVVAGIEKKLLVTNLFA